MSDFVIPKAIEFSPHTQLASGADTTTETECEPVNLAAFPAVAAGEQGVIIFAADEFRSKDPADYQVMTYDERNDGEGKLKGLVHRAGTARAWPADTWVASYGTAWGWEQMRAAVIAHVTEDDTDDVHGYKTYVDGMVRGFKNILINGDFRINQRNFNGNWSTLSNGEYGYDRWKYNATQSTIQQIIEEGNFKPSTPYTISGTAETTAQLT